MTTTTNEAKHVESLLARQTLLDADLTRPKLPPGSRSGSCPWLSVVKVGGRSIMDRGRRRDPAPGRGAAPASARAQDADPHRRRHPCPSHLLRRARPRPPRRQPAGPGRHRVGPERGASSPTCWPMTASPTSTTAWWAASWPIHLAATQAVVSAAYSALQRPRVSAGRRARPDPPRRHRRGAPDRRRPRRPPPRDRRGWLTASTPPTRTRARPS